MFVISNISFSNDLRIRVFVMFSVCVNVDGTLVWRKEWV